MSDSHVSGFGIKALKTLLVLLCASLFTPTFALTRYVNGPAPNYTTIQAAVNASVNGDIILVGAGTYTENVLISGKSLTIRPNGAFRPTIQGLGGASTVYFLNSPNSRLEGFTITRGTGTSLTGPWGGAALFGGGVLVNRSDNTILSNLQVNNCRADNGGGICSFTSNNVTIERTVVTACTAGAGGGIATLSSNAFRVNVSNCLIYSCSATAWGGGIQWNYSTGGTIEHTTIANCQAPNAAAIGRANGATYTARNSIFTNNTPTISQLAWMGGSTATSTVSNSIIQSSSNPTFATNNTNLTLTSNLDVLPQFVNVATDFHLQLNSPAIDAGAATALTNDLDNNCRPKGLPDLGCYEAGTKTDTIRTCAGQSITLTAPVGTSYLWNTGQTTQSITVSAAATTYTVTINAACPYQKSFVIQPTAAPTVTITGATSICAGNATTLTASGGGTYLWNTGAVTATISASTAGTYSVTVTNAAGCKATASATVVVNPLPVATITGTTTICTGSSTVLTASGGGTYLWNTGAATATITATASTYTVTVTSAAGCIATKSVTVVASSPVINLVSQNVSCNGTTSIVTLNISVSGGNAPYTYSWSNGAVTQNLTNVAGTAGSYCVTVTDAKGCKTKRCFDCLNPCSSNTSDPILSRVSNNTENTTVEEKQEVNTSSDDTSDSAKPTVESKEPAKTDNAKKEVKKAILKAGAGVLLNQATNKLQNGLSKLKKPLLNEL